MLSSEKQVIDTEPKSPQKIGSADMPTWLVNLLLRSAIPNGIEDNEKTGVSIWKVDYKSIDPFGNSTVLTGFLLAPTDTAAQKFIVYLHSVSNGLEPSQPTAGLFSVRKMAALGNTVIVPDNYSLKAALGQDMHPSPIYGLLPPRWLWST